MFIVGQDDTRDRIHAYRGGSKQCSLPARNGELVAACLTKELNPRAHEVTLCGVGERSAAPGGILAKQRTLVPVFIKRAVNRWEYQGTFRVKESFTAGPRCAELIEHSGRSVADVSRVVVLESVRDG